jgi:tRNA(adenine34) deaminase
MINEDKAPFFKKALTLAKEAFESDEVPVGAVIVLNGTIIAKASNHMRSHTSPIAHAEMIVIERACQQLKTQHLSDCDLYVTLEPCPMCASAIAHAKIRRLYFGAYDPKGGGVDHGPRIFDHSMHKPEIVGGICRDECSTLMTTFFKNKR